MNTDTTHVCYLLDANILITAKNQYYPLNRVPEFWSWLIAMGQQEKIKIPYEFYEEINKGDDDLVAWMKRSEVKEALLLNEEANTSILRKVMHDGYNDEKDEVALEVIGKDPFIIAYALNPPSGQTRIVVTLEKPKESGQPRKPKNQKITNACKNMNVKYCSTFDLINDLDWSTSWNNPSLLH